MTERSQNGYRAGSASSIGVKTYAVPGYPNVKIPIQQDVAPLLLAMARWFFDNVEKPVIPGCWGYAYRPVRGQTSGLSNHASGTAIDLNAPRHPLGKVGTVPASKRAAIIAKAHSLGLRWGGEYTGRKDEMHFEVNVNWGRMVQIKAALQGKPVPKPSGTAKPSSGVLQQGSTGTAVRSLQARLNRDYPAYSHLTVDGQYGPATTAVVREFQKRAGLSADGIAGPKTLAKLGL